MHNQLEQQLKERNAELEKELTAKNRELEIETALKKSGPLLCDGERDHCTEWYH